ncbi:MAG: GNAT family N-acetyltransferase [Marinovum algicola]|jgi:GNAT superfamily N-acetyltransferase|uniref:N-acetylglutamate synthase, GNAT family n=1 Tax=Marinovum algicola TaxID=42444 RepID=A0A975ZNT1_9RHOB|nr:GNAT family N-acetyltransferase [Marinovum algicola]SEJ64620.1 N-acetylglutamate synthase, GNAT family [Marinovum algicola]SLN53021.1 Acetyltransferase (GNAT) family protein [Marinovum algicola]
MTQLRVLTGAALDAALDDVARLRIAVFRDWPYLYDGDPAYEAAYLESYRNSDRAILVGAFDGTRLIGAATGTPLEDHAEEFRAVAAALPVPLARIFYCAESVLLPAYRGRGIGHAFFDRRERFARAQGFDHALFCAVRRPDDHPLRPAGYRPFDGFWRKRGYAPVAGAEAWLEWQDIDRPEATEKPLQVWMRAL